MHKVSLMLIAGGALLTCLALAQSDGPYKVVKTAKTGGEGGFDYIYADNDGRKLYIPRPGQPNPAPDQARRTDQRILRVGMKAQFSASSRDFYQYRAFGACGAAVIPAGLPTRPGAHGR